MPQWTADGGPGACVTAHQATRTALEVNLLSLLFTRELTGGLDPSLAATSASTDRRAEC